jgi:hypothetical protein
MICLDKGILHHILSQTNVPRDQMGCAHSLHLITHHEEFQSANVTVFESLNRLLFVHYCVYPVMLKKVGANKQAEILPPPVLRYGSNMPLAP